ncbi:MAG: SPOR domain-containing protein [Rhodomicrobium sp.]
MKISGIIRLSLVLALALGFSTMLPGAIRTSCAQSSDGGLASLSKALQSYEDGNYAAASAAIEEAFKAGLSKELSARAILLRGQVNERNGALARALQDYSNALWMDMLPAAERKKASDGKQRVIAAMGLNTPAPATATSPGGVGQANAAGGGSSIPHGTSESSSGGVLGMFDGLFGSKTATSAPAPAAVPEQKPSWQAATAATAPEPPTAASASTVQIRSKDQASAQAVHPAAAARKVAQAQKSPPPPATAVTAASFQPVAMASPSAANGYLIVFGPAGNEEAGRTKARQIKTQVADILVSRELDVEAGPSGGYRIVAGPYKAKSAALALCSAMKQRGVHCEVTP